jgi:hypothetical protein
MVSIDMKLNINIIISALVLMGVIYLAFIKKSETYEDPVVPAAADKPKEKKEPSTLIFTLKFLLLFFIIGFIFWILFANTK